MVLDIHPEKQSRYLDTIYHKTLILERSLDNMTEYSELELGRMQYSFEYVDMTSYLKELMGDYKRDIELNGIRFEHNFLEEPLTVVADRSKLKRVLDNLISNAVKYNKDSGSICISTMFWFFFIHIFNRFFRLIFVFIFFFNSFFIFIYYLLMYS